MTVSLPIASVIVPAHQEETTIGRCVTALLEHPSTFAITVAANGCSDRTVEIARALPVEVLDLSFAGKATALNAADAVASSFPRLYVDADVLLDSDSARLLVDVLDVDEPRLAVPARRLDLVGASWLVRAYYRTWTRVQEMRGDTLGCGVYAVNEAGRRRWDQFPAGIADDYYVHSRFHPEERMLVPLASSVVRPPRTLRSLLAVRSRIYAGNLQLAADHGTMKRADRRPAMLLRDPVALLGVPVYALITLIAKARARRRMTTSNLAWSQDRTGRSL